jgi:ATP-dependent Clp protease protease subunit
MRMTEEISPKLLLQMLQTNQLSDAVVDQLFRNRIIVINTKIDEDVANRVAAQLLRLAAESPLADVTLFINSPGGDLRAGMAIYDTMQFVQPDVATWVVGLASGTAQLLLTAGAPGKRHALPHVNILLKGPWVPADSAAAASWSQPETARYLATLTAANSGRSVERVSADIEQARWFSAEEAAEYGLIDQVHPRLTPAAFVDVPVARWKLFISYVREDSATVDRLADALKSHGIDVWLDRTNLHVGDRWKDAIRQAIGDGDFFLACFSPAYADRRRTYMNEELLVAIEELRMRPRDRRWFLPVMLGQCTIPAHPIGPMETLRDIHAVDIAENWDLGVADIVRVLQTEI